MAVLYYVADPMCSWCYAFQPTIAAIDSEFGERLDWHYVMGGLAKDSDVAMPLETQGFVQENWREIEKRCGIQFNWDFWTQCQPRRSTYPSCRAVIAMRHHSPALEAAMFRAIQKAYYQEAKNPSDLETLAAIAATVDPQLTSDEFLKLITEESVESALQQDFAKRQELGIQSFPSLVLELDDGQVQTIQSGWNEKDGVLNTIRIALKSA